MAHRYVTADSTFFTADALYWTADGDYQHDSQVESGAIGVVAITRIAFDPSGPVSYNEGASVSFQVTFYDSGVETIPTTIRYRIDDDKSGDQILTWTSVSTVVATASDALLIPGAGAVYLTEADNSAGATYTIDIPGSLNVMENEDNRRERRTLTVEADAGGAFAFSASAHYDIINRLGI